MEIKKHLLNTLKVNKIINLTGDKRIHFIHANSPIAPYVEYEIIGEKGDNFSEGKEKNTSYLVQVDIFSTGDYTELEKAIKTEMTNAGYIRDNAVDLYENKTKLYHKAMRFSISLLYEF